MGLVYNKSHIFTLGVRNACYETNATDFLNLYDPGTAGAFARTFRETSTFQFMVDETSKNEILYINCMLVDTRIAFGGGTEVLYTDPTKVNWAMVNRQGYLWIYLHEVDGIHSLVYRSTNRILNTLRRKHYALQYNLVTHVLTLLVDSLPEPLTIDTSAGTFRTAANQFTTLQSVANAGFLVGGGSAYLPTQKGDFTLYYDSYIDRMLTQTEINEKFQVIQDTRALPPPNIGKILIGSDRGATGYDIYRVNGDFTDPVIEVADGAQALYYPRWSRNTAVDDLTFVSYEGGPYYPKVKLGSDVHYAYDFRNPLQAYVINWWDGAKSPTLDIDNKIHGFGLGNTNGGNDMSFWEVDPLNTANSQMDMYNTAPINAISVFGGNLLRYAGSSDSHPINRDKLVVQVKHDQFGNRIVIWDRVTNTIDDILYTDSFADGNRDTMYQPKFNYNGTRVGFTTHLTMTFHPVYGYPIYQDKTAFVVNYDGSNLVNVGTGVDFLCFCSHGAAADKTYSFSRPLVSPEVVTLTLNGVILTPVPFNTDMATTLADIRTELLTQAAVDTVTIVGNTFRILAKIDKSLDLVIAVGGNLSVITTTTTTNTIGVDTEVLIQKYELSLTYALMYYRIYKKNLRTLAEENLSGDVPYNDYWADWKA